MSRGFAAVRNLARLLAGARAWLLPAAFVLAATAPLAASQEAPDFSAPRSNLRYDFDYPGLNYGTAKADNPVARLQQEMAAGKVKLEPHPKFGYLPALLDYLGIDASSQMLIYAKTSLQTGHIERHAPRAIYFNDHTYVGYVLNGGLIEIVTMDPALGLMFYSLNFEGAERRPRMVRETGRCLTCHDAYSMMGGGTPRVMVTSAPVLLPDGTLTAETSSASTDRTPFAERWGGWYVTGSTGGQEHLGNMPLDDPRRQPDPIGTVPRELASIASLFDASHYPRDTSDVVALMVLEHQTEVHNLMTRASFKARTALARVAGPDANPQRWSELPPALQKSFRPLVDPLVDYLTMRDAIRLTGKVTSSSGYDRWFQAQGPRDGEGRSLRDLDLEHRLFRYPLSYMLYTEAFDALPPYLRDYVYDGIVDRLARDEADAASARAALGILAATKPEFAARGPSVTAANR